MEDLLSFAHIGDLHITKAKEQNYIDFMSIVSQIEVECGRQLDFVVLPGDNADNGLRAQYKLVTTALKMLSVPVHIIPGDHDMEQGGLHGFYDTLHAEKLPASILVKGTRCLFLDVCGPGNGGPDFRFGNSQLIWLENELSSAKSRSEKIIVFMHTFPVDLADSDETAIINKLIGQYGILLVDMGHTHYNELANNGQTIFAATRSTGQIEEGPVGYSVITIDYDVISWRFKTLDEPFPFVMITSPADHRLAVKNEHLVNDSVEIKAAIFGSHHIQQVEYRLNNEEWKPMERYSEYNWKALVHISQETPIVTISVKATDDTGRPGLHIIQPATSLYKLPTRVKNGSDADSVGAWPENGITGTKLGPNANAKPHA